MTSGVKLPVTEGGTTDDKFTGMNASSLRTFRTQMPPRHCDPREGVETSLRRRRGSRYEGRAERTVAPVRAAAAPVKKVSCG